MTFAVVMTAKNKWTLQLEKDMATKLMSQTLATGQKGALIKQARQLDAD